MLPVDRATLTAAVEPLEEHAGDLVDVAAYAASVPTHAIVLNVCFQMAPCVSDHRSPTLEPQPRQTLSQCFELVADSLPLRLTTYRKAAAPGTLDVVREAFLSFDTAFLASLWQPARIACDPTLSAQDIRIAQCSVLNELCIRPRGIGAAHLWITSSCEDVPTLLAEANGLPGE
jgi:hypothetical protein